MPASRREHAPHGWQGPEAAFRRAIVRRPRPNGPSGLLLLLPTTAWRTEAGHERHPRPGPPGAADRRLVLRPVERMAPDVVVGAASARAVNGSRVTRHVLLAQRTSSIGGAAPERSLVRNGIQTPGLGHYSVTARTARIRRASQPGEHEAIVGACIVAIAERPFQMLPDLRD